LPEGCSISVPAVINNIYWSAVPAQKYLPERRSGTTTPQQVTKNDSYASTAKLGKKSIPSINLKWNDNRHFQVMNFKD